jgi:8-oxo-dGTP diphosphatase
VVRESDSSNEVSQGIVVCVGGVVLDERRVLLVRQAQGHSLEGQWTIPWGLVDPGEAPEVAVLREIKEEAGIQAEIEGLLGIQNLPDPWDGWLAIIFQCKPIAGVPSPDGGKETDRAGYFSIDDLPDLKVEIWCEWLIKRMLTERHKPIAPEPSNPYFPKLGFL